MFFRRIGDEWNTIALMIGRGRGQASSDIRHCANSKLNRKWEFDIISYIFHLFLFSVPPALRMWCVRMLFFLREVVAMQRHIFKVNKPIECDASVCAEINSQRMISIFKNPLRYHALYVSRQTRMLRRRSWRWINCSHQSKGCEKEPKTTASINIWKENKFRTTKFNCIVMASVACAQSATDHHSLSPADATCEHPNDAISKRKYQRQF